MGLILYIFFIICYLFPAWKHLWALFSFLLLSGPVFSCHNNMLDLGNLNLRRWCASVHIHGRDVVVERVETSLSVCHVTTNMYVRDLYLIQSMGYLPFCLSNIRFMKYLSQMKTSCHNSHIHLFIHSCIKYWAHAVNISLMHSVTLPSDMWFV